MKGWVVYSIVVSVIAVGAIGVAVGFAVSRATDHSGPKVEATATAVQLTAGPTEFVPQLTGSEAAAKAHNYLLAGTKDATTLGYFIGFKCTEEDFNQRDQTWIVGCAGKISNTNVTFTYGVDDATGAVTLISP
jgi:hypothetical protein